MSRAPSPAFAHHSLTEPSAVDRENAGGQGSARAQLQHGSAAGRLDARPPVV